MRIRGLVQDELYGRFLARVTDVGGFGDITAIRALWDAQRAAVAAQAAQQAAAGQSTLPAAPVDQAAAGSTSQVSRPTGNQAEAPLPTGAAS